MSKNGVAHTKMHSTNQSHTLTHMWAALCRSCKTPDWLWSLFQLIKKALRSPIAGENVCVGCCFIINGQRKQKHEIQSL